MTTSALAPAPSSTFGTDFLRVAHAIYHELYASAFHRGRGALDYAHPPADHLAHGLVHSKMVAAAALVNRAVRTCGKSPWTIVAHTDECDAPHGNQEKFDSHLCGFYAIRINEGEGLSQSVKVTFPLVGDGPEWVWEIAADIVKLFELSGSTFKWNR
jgi:hypothetical protein